MKLNISNVCWVKVLQSSPTWHAITSLEMVLPPVVNHLFYPSWVELVQIHHLKQLVDHRLFLLPQCCIFSRFIASLWSSSASGWEVNLFASYASHSPSVSTSSAAKHLKLYMFNEQQNSSVPKGKAFFSFLFSGVLMLLCDFFFHCCNNDTLKHLFLGV